MLNLSKQYHCLYSHTAALCLWLSALKVLEIFEEVQKRHRLGQTNPGFEDDDDLPEKKDKERDLSSVEDNTTESGSCSEPSTPTSSPSPVLRNEP